MKQKKKLFVWATEHCDLVWRRCFDRDFTYNGQNFVSYADLESYYIIDNIKLCEENPKYKFTVESPAMLKKFLEHHSEYEPKIKALIKNGQLNMPFTGYCIIDSNMVNGESIVRNYLYGQNYLKNNFNYTPYVIDRNDAFGNSAQLPQIARGFGVKWISEISYSRPDNLYWEGLDGSRVLTWQPDKIVSTGGYYKYRPCPECKGFKIKDCKKCNNRRIDTEYMEGMRVKLSNETINYDGDIPPMVYCGGEEILPNNHIFEWIDQNSDKYDVEFACYDSYLPYLQKMLDEVDTVGAEQLHSSKELNTNNTGTFVTRINTKKSVRENENAILSLETLLTAYSLKGKKYPYKELGDIWYNYLFTVFHDSVTATHIDAAYNEIMDTANMVKDGVNSIKQNLLAEFSKHDKNILTVYNPYGCIVSNEVTVTVESDADVFITHNKNKVHITDYKKLGNRITLTFIVKELDAFSKRTYIIEETGNPPEKIVDTVYHLNEYTGKPVLTNEVESQTVTESFETYIENARYKVKANHNGICEIFDKKLKKVIASQSEYMVGEFILEHDEGSPWATHSPDMRRFPMAKHTHLIEIEKNDYLKKLTFVIRPTDLDGNSVMGFRVKYSVVLKDDDMVHFETKVFWHTQNYRLRIAIPTFGDAKHFYDIPYGVIERKPYQHNIIHPNGAINWASAAGDWPAINWAGVEYSDYSLAMFNKGTPSYQINKDANGNTVMYLSVLRSPTIGSYLNEPTEYAMIDYYGMLDSGEHYFDYAIKAYADGFENNTAVVDGVSYNAKLVVANGTLDVPKLVTLKCEHAKISSVKRAEDDNGIIVRITEFHGKDTKAELVIPENIKPKAVYISNLKEEKVQKLNQIDGKVKLDIGHFEIKTVYIEN